MFSRRALLRGAATLLAAPAIVRCHSLMAISPWDEPMWGDEVVITDVKTVSYTFTTDYGWMSVDPGFFAAIRGVSLFSETFA